MTQHGWRGSLRVAGLYMAGVTLGVMGASIVQPEKNLSGGSAGCYALVTAHIGNIFDMFSTCFQVFNMCPS
jgi:hypothetical protein